MAPMSSVFIHNPISKLPSCLTPIIRSRSAKVLCGPSRSHDLVRLRSRSRRSVGDFNNFTPVSDSILPSDCSHHQNQVGVMPNLSPSDPFNPGTVTPLIAAPIALNIGPPAISASAFHHILGIACSLSKARLSLLVVSTATVGCVLAASTSMASDLFLAHPVSSTLCLAVGTGLTSCAANTFNQIIEIPFDSQMVRTRNRALVRGLATPGQAGLFAVTCAGLGLATLYLSLNSLVATLAAFNILLYTTIYTPLKQIDQSSTWIGALVGAVPPLMGWAAATGHIQSGSLILAGLLYVWQFPHFMALSWNLRHEYSKAGYMMTSVLEPGVCKGVALRYAVASSLVCLAGAGCSAISLGPWAGCALGFACLPPNIGLIYYAWQFFKSEDSAGSSAAARSLFKATLFHLPVVMTAAMLGTYGCVLGLA